MYTELILGCRLKKSTPIEVIDTIKWLISDNTGTQPPNTNHPDLENNRISWMFMSSGSYYFGVRTGYVEFEYDEIAESYRLQARFNIKNYCKEIETFLAWLKPCIAQGSGNKNMYAVVTYEEGEPELFFIGENSND